MAIKLKFDLRDAVSQGIRNKTLRLFILFFIFTCSTALLVQIVILPFFLPELHAGHGLLIDTDSVHFHQVASQMAKEMHEKGWSQFKLFPKGSGIPSSIAALIYYFTVSEPFILIPLNAFVHALSALFLIFIFRGCLGINKGAVYGALPFLALPSASSWYAQIHRDGYCFLGFFLVVHAWINFARISEWAPFFWRKSIIHILETLVGGAIICLARQYVLQLLTNFLPLICALLLCHYFYLWLKNQLSTYLWMGSSLICILAVLLLRPFAVSGYETQFDLVAPSESRAPEFINEKQSWHRIGLPEAVEMRLFHLSVMRDGSRYRPHTKEGSHIDDSVRFKNATDVLKYVPRAIQIALFSPFPNSWFKVGFTRAGRLMRIVSVGEMLIVYVGVILFLSKFPLFAKSLQFWVAFLLCLAFLLVYSMGVTNLGALYRYRYGYLMLLVGLGLVSFKFHPVHQYS